MMVGKRGLRGDGDRRELPSEEEGEEYNSKQGFRTQGIYVLSFLLMLEYHVHSLKCTTIY